MPTPTRYNGSVFTVERRVGKLVEARVQALRTLEDLQRYELNLRTVLLSAGPGAVGCSDLRAAELFPPDVAAGLVALLTRDNGTIIRSALLLATQQSTVHLQIERIVREAGNPARRTFRDPVELMAWVSGALLPEERDRLHAFLAEAPARSRLSVPPLTTSPRRAR